MLTHSALFASPLAEVSILIVFLGQILPGVKVIIANTETKGPLGDSHLGEVRICLPAKEMAENGTE